MADNADVDAWDESQHWVTEADRYDGQLAPFAELVLERVALDAGEVVLDVGCGCGATTIDAARVCAAATGVDVCAGVLAVARQRADDAQVANVEFVEADAQRHVFASAGFDAVISRFGLMFFDDLLFAGAAPDARHRAIDAVIDALADYYEPGLGVVLGTGAWLVSATSPHRS